MESSDHSEGVHQKRKRTFTLEEVQESLKKLNALISEGKNEKDAEVKKQVENIRAALDIPKECWMNSSHQLKDLVQNLQEKLNVVGSSPLSAKWIGDKDVLKNASGGLALEGVYLTRNPEDLLTKREQLVELGNSFSLRSPEQYAQFEQREFSSHHSETVFQKVMEKLGRSFTCSLNVGFKAFSFGFGLEKKYSEETEYTSSHTNEQSHVLNTKYHYIPQASGYFKKENIHLSTGALEELQHIELILLNTNDGGQKYNRIKTFYEQFGSHVNKGPIHFGGVFWWKASLSGFKTTDVSEAKKLTSESLDVYCGASYGLGPLSVSGKIGTSSSKVKGNFTGKYRDDLITQLNLSISKTGGPAEIDDHFVWKSHLAASNKTWSVIDRGTDLIPVWEIVLTSHRGDFRNVSELSKTLRETYTKITGMTAEQAWGENVLSEMERAETVIQSIQEWSVSDCEYHLTQLLKVKCDVSEKTGSSKIWVQTYLSSGKLQQYLYEVATASGNSSGNLKWLMKSLFDCADFHNLPNFPQRKAIMEWAYQKERDTLEPVSSIATFPEVENILQNVIKTIRDDTHAFSSAKDEECVNREATKMVTRTLNSFCKTLKDQGQKESEVLVLSILVALDYSNEHKTFNHLLKMNEIMFLQSELQKASSTYTVLRDQCPVQAQAFLVNHALTVSDDKDIPVPHEAKEERLNFIQTQLEGQLFRPIVSAIKENRNDWYALEKELFLIQENKMDQDQTPKSDKVTTELENILTNSPAPLDELPQTSSPRPAVPQDGANRGQFMDLLKRLGLHDSFPKKLTKAEVLKIDQLSLYLSEPKVEQDLRSLSLYKLMMLDYRSRYVFLKPAETVSISHEDSGDTSKDVDESDDEEDDEDDDDDDGTLEDFSKETHIHPMDLQMAIFHCSNDFLRQYIYLKLSTCQFSLPFLVPNPCSEKVEFPLWALRHIRKSWHSKTQTPSDSSGKYHNKIMFDTPVPIVCFLRLGKSKLNSKSQILNSVISRQKHNVFFHRNIKGSTPHSLLMNGVVDIAWHCPGGRKDDLFDDCAAFLNLHGDAEDHPQQLEFLKAVSTVNVLIRSEHPLSDSAKAIYDELSESSVPLICLFSGKSKIGKSKNVTKLAAKQRNQDELTEELISCIKQSINKSKKTATIQSSCEQARRQKFIVDEDDQSCNDGFAQAETLMCLLKGVEVSNLKRTFLPLQGDLWYKWCAKDKEQYRLQIKENESIEQQKSKIVAELTSIRKRQYTKADPPNDFMRSFLECLTTPLHSRSTRLYMLQWLLILLDDLASHELALLENKQQSTWRNIKSVRKDKVQTANLLQSLDQINDQIANTTVGLQHIMREVIQLFESAQTVLQTEKNAKLFSTLPKMGANMLLSGYPLEIMDGDASHVPLTWIKAVFDELIRTIGDKKMFVLSILGLQSSGKSTLLNTMFGLQFAVSAGRCTRGAFMQLLKVDMNLQNEFGYEYVLIVDTEGLRSLELSTKISLNHDNELATFIIGIGDTTVINIMGENPSEMQDILQICVQAFLRMRQVKITPSCIFVHQNVAESSASDKNIEGRRRLLEKLDEMAVLAASEENIDNVTCFSDVIHFDIDAQVFYFKNLLEGDPPMAPPNPSYTENVQELKLKLLKVASWKEGSTFSKLSQFKCRVSDLWKALLQENFVFSFKNTVELMVYNALEREFLKWSWELRKHSMNLQNELENQIGSNIIQDIPITVLAGKYETVYDKLKSEIDKYFKDDKNNKETLIKWKVKIEKQFESLRDDLIVGTEKKCKDLLIAKKNRSDLDMKKIRYLNELTDRSKKLASKLKKTEQLTDTKVVKEFEELWTDWTTDVLRSQPKEERLQVRAMVESALFYKFRNQQGIREKIQHFSAKKGFLFEQKKHIDQAWYSKVIDWVKGKSFDHAFGVLQTSVTRAVNSYISAKEQKTGFDVNFIHEILSNIVEKQVAEFESASKNPKFTIEFRVDLSVYHCLKNVDRFQNMHDEFKKANLPLTYLQNQKDKYLQSFMNYCKGASSVTIFVDFLCQHITPEVLRVAEQKVSQQIADSMKSNEPAFTGNRSNLEDHILKHLATKQNFSMYEEYIDHPKDYFRRFIQENVDEFTNNSREQETYYQENLRSLKNQILAASTTIATNESEKSGNAKTWLDSFCPSVGGLISINRDELCDIENEEISDWQFFKDEMADSLEEIIQNKAVNKEALRETAADVLSQQMEGCWAKCPFCKAICTYSSPDHDGKHSVRYHRCDALGGWHYHGTDNFSVDFCTTCVSSDQTFFAKQKNEWFPYKSYPDAGDPYDKWSITPDDSIQRYWKWFICQFQSEWENRHGYKFHGRGTIPSEWMKITKESVLEELD